jgi:putative transposase
VRKSVPDSSDFWNVGFQKIIDAFLLQPGLPFASVLTAEKIVRIFRRHGGLFGENRIYNTAVVLWAFLGQVLRDRKEASCQSAVANIISFCLQVGHDAPTEDTGDYCRARAKLSEPAIRELSRELANDAEHLADDSWLWKGRHAKLVDGFTFTMPDTAKNQAEFPQPRTQKKGVGLPIARSVVILSLATAMVMDVVLGPYKGKETGESALLRQMMNSLMAGDVVVFDRYYCSFMLIAQLLNQRVDVCARLHHLRHADFRKGRRLGKYDHIIVWTKPQKPAWMNADTYATIPETLELRELRYAIVEKGKRTKSITVVTTLTDIEEYSKEEIAELYGCRWSSELDIRSVKDSLNLSHVRCKSPEMVRIEFRTTFLAYNLTRLTAASASFCSHQKPRSISFTGTCQFVLGGWAVHASGLMSDKAFRQVSDQLLKRIAACRVGNRPGRLEPRVIKRRRHGYPLMQKPRHVLKAELRKHCT